MTTAVIVSGAFFARRTFCRYLCFLGGLSGNYARTGVVALRANTDICATCDAKAACYNGTDTTKPCPLFTFPRTMDSNAACNLCAECVKSCPNDAITLTVRKPTSELWFVRKPKLEESFLAMAIMGIVLIQNLTMLEVWKSGLGWLEATTGITNKALIFTPAFAVAIIAPVALLVGAAWIASRRNPETTWQNFARFGYALIPLDVAGHVAHNLFHFLGEGGAIVATTGALVGITAQERLHGPAAAARRSRPSSSSSSRSGSGSRCTRCGGSPGSATRRRGTCAGPSPPSARWSPSWRSSTSGCSCSRWPTGCRSPSDAKAGAAGATRLGAAEARPTRALEEALRVRTFEPA